MVAEVERELGPVDTLVANASIGFPIRPFVDYGWPEFQAKLVGELGAAFFCCQAVVPGMIARRGGCIVAVSSGLSRHPGGGFCAHSAAKGGLDALMRALALELGPHGIRVNVVGPGLTETDATAGLPAQVKEGAARATPLGRVGRPEDVAGAVLMLASGPRGLRDRRLRAGERRQPDAVGQGAETPGERAGERPSLGRVKGGGPPERPARAPARLSLQRRPHDLRPERHQGLRPEEALRGRGRLLRARATATASPARTAPARPPS